eukprot:scaffold120939_cov18-Phaeocystis_antarctica.AAC.1
MGLPPRGGGRRCLCGRRAERRWRCLVRVRVRVRVRARVRVRVRARARARVRKAMVVPCICRAVP